MVIQVQNRSKIFHMPEFSKTKNLFRYAVAGKGLTIVALTLYNTRPYRSPVGITINTHVGGSP